MNARETIDAGKAILGIEFGSTRIKAVLIDQDGLDAGGAELDPEDGFSGFDGSPCVHLT